MPEFPAPGPALLAEAIFEAYRRAREQRENEQCFDQWVTLVSSNLDQFFYDSSTGDLTIEFHGARQYKYFRIAPEQVIELCRTGSPGKWWWANLHGAPAQRL